MQELLGEAFQPWRIHDLRRTAASGMAALGFQPHVIERVLNHVSGAQGGLVGVYQRHEYREERKRAIMAWGAHLMDVVSAEASASNVVPLRVA
jgi:integrase